MLPFAIRFVALTALAALTLNVAAAQTPEIDPTQIIQDPNFQPGQPFEIDSGYGCSVAIDGDTAVVYAGRLPEAYVYRSDPSSGLWTQVQEIEFAFAPAVNNCRSHYALALQDDTLLVAGGGPVLVYLDDGSGFAFETRFAPEDGAVLDDRVFLDQRTAAVSGEGSAYVFVRSGETWTQEAELRPADGTAGRVSALHRDTLLFSALDGTAVYVFVRRGTDWIEQQKLQPTGAVNTFGPSFGASAALHNNVAVIGAPRDAEIVGPPRDEPVGAAFVFVRHGTTWTQQQKLLTRQDLNGSVGFGASVAIEHGIIIVSAPFTCGPDCLNTGSIYGFIRRGTTWNESFVGAGTFGFGLALSLRNGQLLAGGTGVIGRDPGEVRFYELRPLPIQVRDGDTQSSITR